MIEPGRKRQDLARRPLDHLFRPPSFLRGFLHQPVGERGPEVAIPGLVFRQVLEAFHEQFGRLAGQLQHAFRRHAEPAGRNAVRHSTLVLERFQAVYPWDFLMDRNRTLFSPRANAKPSQSERNQSRDHEKSGHLRGPTPGRRSAVAAEDRQIVVATARSRKRGRRRRRPGSSPCTGTDPATACRRTCRCRLRIRTRHHRRRRFRRCRFPATP